MFKEILIIVLRSCFSYIVLLVILRCLGRKSVSEMTFFDFGVTLVMGELAAVAGMGGDTSARTAVIVLLTYGVLGVLTGYLHLNQKLNKIINSTPLVVIDNGQILKRTMRKARLAVTDLTELLREKSYFDINDVKYAILERNGKLSVLPRAAKAPLTPSDMNLRPPDKELTKDLIINGKLYPENLSRTNLTDSWLYNELKRCGIHDIKKVFYAAVDASGNLYLSEGGPADDDVAGRGDRVGVLPVRSNIQSFFRRISEVGRFDSKETSFIQFRFSGNHVFTARRQSGYLSRVLSMGLSPDHKLSHTRDRLRA